MRTAPCPACRHDVPVGRWCNWCGARLAPPARHRPETGGGPRAMVAVVVAVLLAVAGGTTVVLTGQGADLARPDDADVVLDDRVAGPVPDGSGDRAGPVQVARPGGPAGDTPAPRVTGPRTDVVCSDLQVRSVPTAELATTEEGELVELAHGPCVVMGPEGTAVP